MGAGGRRGAAPESAVRGCVSILGEEDARQPGRINGPGPATAGLPPSCPAPRPAAQRALEGNANLGVATLVEGLDQAGRESRDRSSALPGAGIKSLDTGTVWEGRAWGLRRSRPGGPRSA
jgi:hypothetical protein